MTKNEFERIVRVSKFKSAATKLLEGLFSNKSIHFGDLMVVLETISNVWNEEEGYYVISLGVMSPSGKTTYDLKSNVALYDSEFTLEDMCLDIGESTGIEVHVLVVDSNGNSIGDKFGKLR